MRIPHYPVLLAVAAMLSATGCSRRSDGGVDIEKFPPYDNTGEREAFYKHHLHPAVVKQIEDLAGLQNTARKEGKADEEASLATQIQQKQKETFFQFKTRTDVPGDLKWTDGGDLPEIGDPSAKKGGTLRFYMPAFPPTLRIVGTGANNSFRSEHWDDIYITQVTEYRNQEGAYFPGVAKQWAVAPDNRTVYYQLDPEATFSNGDPVQVDDFFMMFYIMLSPHHNDPWYTNFYNEKFTTVTKYDDLTFSITLAEPRPDPVYWTQIVPASRRFYQEYGPDFLERYNWRKYPTTGAYDIDADTEMIKGRTIILHRVKDWFLRDRKHYRYRYNADYLAFDVILQTEKAFEAFRRGDIDYFPLKDPVYWNEKMDIPEFNNGYIWKTTFYNEYPLPPWGVYINAAKKPLDDLRVRRGIQYSMNWEKVLAIEFRGELDRLNTTSDGFGRLTNPNIKARGFSVAKAREEFAAAGYTQDGSDGILRKPTGERLSIQLSIRDVSLHRRIALRLKEEAKKAGLELTIEMQDNTSGFKKIREKNHQLSIMAWNSTPPYPVYWEGYHSDNAFEKKKDGTYDLNPDGTRKTKPNTNNITSTAVPELDKVIDEFEKAQTFEVLQRTAFECERLIYEDAGFSPGWGARWYRYGYWRWVRWPKDFNVKISDIPVQSQVYWIDEDIKAETLRARKAGEALSEPVENVFDQYPHEMNSEPLPHS